MPASEQKPKASLLKRILNSIFPATQSNQQSSYEQTQSNDQTENNINEDSKGDFLALDEPDLIFSEEE